MGRRVSKEELRNRQDRVALLSIHSRTKMIGFTPLEKITDGKGRDKIGGSVHISPNLMYKRRRLWSDDLCSKKRNFRPSCKSRKK